MRVSVLVSVRSEGKSFSLTFFESGSLAEPGDH